MQHHLESQESQIQEIYNNNPKERADLPRFSKVSKFLSANKKSLNSGALDFMICMSLGDSKTINPTKYRRRSDDCEVRIFQRFKQNSWSMFMKLLNCVLFHSSSLYCEF